MTARLKAAIVTAGVDPGVGGDRADVSQFGKRDQQAAGVHRTGIGEEHCIGLTVGAVPFHTAAVDVLIHDHAVIQADDFA